MAHDLICPPESHSRAFDLTRPARHLAPLIFVSAHSGRDYSEDFLAAARLDATALRKSEDAFVDELFAATPALGAPLLAARFPRAWCDANREPWELDPSMFDEPLPDWVNSASPRVGAGLGTIARVVASGEAIYRRRLSFQEAELRVRLSWEPFHAALAALVAETRERFGTCLLVDCHSMPTAASPPGEPPDFVLGDAHGSACAPRATRAVEALLQASGRKVQRNDPYAGGYITRHYGRPRENIHAIQIEIARGLYMDERTIQRAPAFAAFQEEMAGLVESLLGLGWDSLLRGGK
ncbi:N-formylglutamate amidohydrolase [Sediminicoccus sp. KRV36]|uniref:N-formylglutamate amidohydrolase n=1 Tax=Sediminicoccus sp. KRV36 TaxID=3133721 RepID=UPI00200FFDB3|nr:N-formylglutamate amidohydrolase [Sediminicoccus rosea]UPY35757.1 N-formylglutamate amidohydrolase [Sediminicoccus rosea]